MIGPTGVIRKVDEKVNPQGHEQTLLQDINQLKGT